jgi:predicted MFS family arabinose efflux permease
MWCHDLLGSICLRYVEAPVLGTERLRLIGAGCELWAPWSEELGRKPILQASLLLVNIWQLPVALAKNFSTIMVGRLLGGLSSAGGSVTLGMIADMWDSEHQVCSS